MTVCPDSFDSSARMNPLLLHHNGCPQLRPLLLSRCSAPPPPSSAIWLRPKLRLHCSALAAPTQTKRTDRWVENGGVCSTQAGVLPRRRPKQTEPLALPRWGPAIENDEREKWGTNYVSNCGERTSWEVLKNK